MKGNTAAVFLICSIIATLSSNRVCSQTNMADPFEKKKPLREAFTTLPLGAVKPMGWLKQQLTENLDGFTGHLDSLAPDLILTDDIYGAKRLSKNIKSKNVGAIGDEGDWQVQFLWWNSETQSNWLDGYIRTAVLVNSEPHLQKIKRIIAKILATQDEDGYIGIYDKELRYHFNNENGELWAKTTLYRALLSWYEYSKDKTVLVAVQRAVDNVLSNYPAYQSHPFYTIKQYVGGLSHGLVFTDVLETMYRLTGKQEYLDYCLFLYKDFSEQILVEDAQYKNLVDTTLPLKGHGVHSYEHVRAIAAAWYASGNNALQNGLNNYLKKIAKTTLPSGAPAGDEYIGGRSADATNTGYEYCSLYELMESYESLYAKTGEAVYGDKIERLFFNAAQGSRHPDESAICYLKTDNSYYLTGGKNGDTADKKQTRYRYSPVHKEAAVCCVPNAGKIAPSYTQQMWMKDDNALLATTLGPCELNTVLNDNNISIQEITNYPFENEVRFVINVSKPASFILKIRRPSWTRAIHVSADYTEENNFIVIKQQWNKQSEVTLRFEAVPQTFEAKQNEIYFMYGPLVLAHGIEATKQITKRYAIAGLEELAYEPTALVKYQYNKQPMLKASTDNDIHFNTILFNPQSGKEEPVVLEPMWHTILRQVTFKSSSQ
jgi:DUF1680 family protein